MLLEKVSTKNPGAIAIVVNLQIVAGVFEHISLGNFFLQLGNRSVLLLSLQKVSQIVDSSF